jgi:hypothetical protein
MQEDAWLRLWKWQWAEDIKKIIREPKKLA